jgi:FKBP-type peptidyl-prolyl cis-trans isomerase
MRKILIAAFLGITILLSFFYWKNKEVKKEKTPIAFSEHQVPPKLHTLLKIEMKEGKGKAIKDGDTAVIHYTGMFLNGKDFDTTYARNKTFEFKLGTKQVIEGWNTGLNGMKAGGKRILVVPAQMAYGEKGNGPVPPSADLRYIVELVDIKK